MTELAIRVNMPREMGWLERFGWDGTVILPAHVLEGVKKRAASMVKRLGCPYVIDPHTYVLGAMWTRLPASDGSTGWWLNTG